MPESEITRIIDELDREFSGDAWHGSPLRQILAGIDHNQALVRPIEGGHNIWELVLHLTGWKNEVRRRVAGAPAGDPPEGDWPQLPATPDSHAWRQAIDELEAAHRDLVMAIEAMSEAQLYEPTNDPRNRATGQGVTHYVMLHGIVQHDVYHSGQIALLKKAVAWSTSGH